MKSKTPAVAEVSRVSFPNSTLDTFSLSALRAQHIASRFALQIETAAIIAAIAFGGAA